MIAALAGALAFALMLSLPRLFAGPTLYDRLLAANAVGAKAVLIAAALGVLLNRSGLIDAAITLALALFAMNVATLKYFRSRTFQTPLARLGADQGAERGDA